MNEQMLGADPEELRALAKLFNKYSSALESTSSQLHPTIMRARWTGPDAQRFRQDWTARLRPQIKSASEMFTDTADKLQAQAREQETASSESSLSGSGGNGSGNAGGGNSGDKSPSTLQDELENLGNRSEQDVRDWWNGLSDEQQKELLDGQDENGIPNAYYLAALEDKLPLEDQRAIREHLVETAKSSIPMYSHTDKIGVDGQIAWVHGGAHLSSQITQNADGSVKLTLAGDVGGGVNTPGTAAGANATLSGELSKTYTFNSLEEALAAREQMLNDLPPDSFGRASEAVKNPGEYIEGTLDTAANHHGSTKEYLNAKGTLSIGVTGEIADGASASATLDLAYERNLDDGTASASVKASVSAELDLGEGMKFGGDGEAGVTLSMDKDGDIQKMTIDLKGTLEGSAEVQANPNAQDPLAEFLGETPVKEGPSAEAAAGVQGTVSLELQNTPENQGLIQSYLGNTASGNDQGAAADLEKIYHASAVTVQANSVVSTENNLVDFDSGAASLKVGASSETTVNAGTAHKSAYDESYQPIRGESHYGPAK